MESIIMGFWRLGGGRRRDRAADDPGEPGSGADPGSGSASGFEPAQVRDFEVEMKKRVHPVVLDFIHTGKRRMLYFAEQGFKVSAEDLVTPYQEKRIFLNARERHAAGRGWDELERLHYGEEQFDGVYARYLFNYFVPDDALRLVAWICRVLKPGGVLATTFAHQRNLPPADGRTAVLTTERYLKKKTTADRLVKLYENREIENLLADFRLLKVVTMKNGDRRALAIKKSGSE
jgi:SAM-dependent methyltransferase